MAKFRNLIRKIWKSLNILNIWKVHSENSESLFGKLRKKPIFRKLEVRPKKDPHSILARKFGKFGHSAIRKVHLENSDRSFRKLVQGRKVPNFPNELS